MSDLQDQIAALSPAELALLQSKLKKLNPSAAAAVADGISPRADSATAPLSFTQQRIWFLDQLEPGIAAYNRLAVYRLQGELNLTALENSLTEIIRRHEILRTTFTADNGQPNQIIAPPGAFSIALHDITATPEDQKEKFALELAAREGQQPFDLSQGPLLRAKVLRLSDAEHFLLITMHHIITDGWSLSIFLRELTDLYRAFSSGSSPTLPHLPIQYADFALWQRQSLRGPALDRQLAYWKKQLAGAPDLLLLPTDHPRPPLQSYRGAVQRFELDGDVTAALKQLSQEQGVTLFMLMLAVFEVLLSRYTGERDIVVGTPIANRSRVEMEELIGFFANTLVLRVEVEEEESFEELVGRVREVCLGAYAHQDVPFERLVEEVRPERKLSHSPLFQVMLVLQNALPPQRLELSNLRIEPLDVSNGTAKFDLLLMVTEKQESLSCVFEYSTDLFEASTIERLTGHFKNLLGGVLENAGQQVWQLPMLPQSEQQQVLSDWNRTQTDYPRQSCIHHFFEAQVEQTPDKIALSFEDYHLSYRQLNERANQLAHYLQSLGVEPGALVGLCLERSWELIVAILGILKSGAAYVPLEPSYPAERLRFMLDDTRAPVLLAAQRFQHLLDEQETQVVYLDTAWKSIDAQSIHNPSAFARADSLAYVMYTSGSTGMPKGVAVTHRSVMRLARETNYAELSEQEVFLQFAPISFDASTLEIWCSLLNGARLAVMPPQMNSLHELGTAIRDYRVTILWLTAGLFHLMVDHRLEDLSSLRQCLAGGDVLSVSHVKKFLQAAPGSRLINGYGPTENTTFTCCHQMTETSTLRNSVPIGRPISNTQVYLLDRHLQPVPVGVAGELYIGGDGLAQGYLNQAELTAEKFIPHPFSREPGARMYRSGDLARYRADGVIEFLGRADTQVKLRGFRIELGEIEEILTKHPDVKEAVIVARKEPRGEKTLVAYVVKEQPQGADMKDLRNYLRQKLPAYMVPSAFVLMDELPLTPNGKVDRTALPAPDLSQRETNERYVAARDAIEEMLVNIWAEVLGRERIGIFDKFFDLGGHSLLATQVLSRIREAFAIELSLRALFESPTVAALAQEVVAAMRGGAPAEVKPLLAARRETAAPLSFAQQRLWFMEQLWPGSPLYSVPMAYRAQGKLKLEDLEQSIGAIIKRHEVLRTRFKVVDEDVRQIVEDGAEFKLELVNLEELAEPERAQLVQGLSEEEARRGFDLAQGPLLRVKVLRLHETEHILLITFHHIITDGWSLSIFLRELTALYQGFSTGSAPDVPPLPIQYIDFALWQRDWLQGATLHRQLAYWKKQLAGAPDLLLLPTDHPRPPLQSYRGAVQRFELDGDVTAALKQLSQEQGVTLFMLMLAVFEVLLSRYTGERDIVVGTPIANRSRVETEELIGFFANTLVLRVEVEEEESFEELVGRVREVCLGAYAHQDVPFERLVEEVRPERKLSHSPLFQVVFSLEHDLNTELESNGLKWNPVMFEGQTSKFDLFLQFHEAQNHLRGRLVYSLDLFEPDTISYMLGHLKKLLHSVVAQPDARLSKLDMLLDEERKLLEQTNRANDFQSGFAGESDFSHLSFD